MTVVCFLLNCELSLYLPLVVQSRSSEWIKLVISNFRIVWAKNPRDPHDIAPLKLSDPKV